MIAYKNRKLDPTKPVEVYRCLNRKGITYSVRQQGLVVGHTENIVLTDCKLIVSQTRRVRVVLNKKRSVHAWIQGTIGSEEDINSESRHAALKYNPYTLSEFHIVTEQGMLPVHRASVVYTSNKQFNVQLD